MNVTIDLAKKHLQDKPDDVSILRADLIKVIRYAEELEQQVKNCDLADVVKSECKTCGGKKRRREFDGSIVICLDC